MVVAVSAKVDNLVSLPEEPGLDDYGSPMQILYPRVKHITSIAHKKENRRRAFLPAAYDLGDDTLHIPVFDDAKADGDSFTYCVGVLS